MSSRFEQGSERLRVLEIVIAHGYGESPLDCALALRRRCTERFRQGGVSIGSRGAVSVFSGGQTRKQSRIRRNRGALLQSVARVVHAASFFQRVCLHDVKAREFGRHGNAGLGGLLSRASVARIEQQRGNPIVCASKIGPYF